MQVRTISINIGSIKKIEIICYGKAEDSKSISLSFKGFLSNIKT